MSSPSGIPSPHRSRSRSNSRPPRLVVGRKRSRIPRSLSGASRNSLNKILMESQENLHSTGGSSAENVTSTGNLISNTNIPEVKPKGDVPVHMPPTTSSNTFWSPTISHQGIDLTGLPCPKPVETSSTITGPSTEDHIQKNLTIVASNIRRKKMLIWIIIYTLVLVCSGFHDILEMIISEDSEIFSVALLKPWFVPVVSCELALTIVGILAMLLRMMYLEKVLTKLMFRGIMSFNCTQYLLMIFVLPVCIYILSIQLMAEMKDSLVVSFEPEADPEWNVTQYQRQCCGIHNRTDWQVPQDTLLTMKDFVEYPTSCCKNGFSVKPNPPCTEASNDLWTAGCHEREILAIFEYMVRFTGLVTVALILSATGRLWMDKLNRYLVIYR